jgi:site-specific DNA recombinase
VVAQTIEARRLDSGVGWAEAAVYARRSTEENKKDRDNRTKQIESTIHTQTQGCLTFARERRYHVAEDAIFQEHFTGMELWDRPALSELRARIRARQYSALICHSTDRLARHPIHIAIVAEECERAGCELIFVTEPLDNSPEAGLIRYIKGYAAQIEREKFRERVKRQRAEILGAGRLICTGAPKYGYDWDTKNRCRVRHEQTAQVVFDIFNLTIEGLSGRVIADRLQAARVPSPSKRQGRIYKDARDEPLWNNTMISRILRDEAYAGKTFANMYRTTTVRLKNGKMKVGLAPRSEWIELPDGVTPPIVTTEMFEAARAVVEENKRKANYKRNRNRPFLLRGFIFCDVCKNPMYPEEDQIRVMKNRVRSVTGHIGLYRCSHGRRKVNRVNPDIKCDGGRIYASDIEGAVWDKVLSFLSNPNAIAAEVEKVLSDMPDDALRADMEAAERELAKIQRVRLKMVDKWKEAVAEGDDDLANTFDADIKKSADDIKAYRAVIADLTDRIAAYQSVSETVDRFQEYCLLVAEGMRGQFTFEEKRAALQALNVRVFAARNRDIRIKLSTGVVLQTPRGSAPSRAAP